MRSRAIAIVAVNVLVFMVLAEVAALALYFDETGRLFYTHRKSYELISETAARTLTSDALHPYFGPTHKPGHRPETNNFGFGSPQPFPFVRTTADQFIIGTFGGSVGRWFCDRGMSRLIARLKRDDFYAQKEIVPLCLSHEGYKQPQQALVAAYFLSIGQQFDLVINIDGFNEVALGAFNNDRGRDISMPSPIHLDALINLIDPSTMTVDRVHALAAIDRHKARLNTLAGAIGRNRIASVNFVLERLYARRRNAYWAERGRFNDLPATRPEDSLVQVTPSVKAREGEGLYRDIAANWVNASRLMRDMLSARGAAYMHILQPNQYFSRRIFGEAEARLARNQASPFRPHVEQGYPALIDAARALTPGVNFFSAVDIFDREEDAVYEDDCCHYNQRGNDLLADFIAARILETDRETAGGRYRRR